MITFNMNGNGDTLTVVCTQYGELQELYLDVSKTVAKIDPNDYLIGIWYSMENHNYKCSSSDLSFSFEDLLNEGFELVDPSDLEYLEMVKSYHTINNN